MNEEQWGESSGGEEEKLRFGGRSIKFLLLRNTWAMVYLAVLTLIENKTKSLYKTWKLAIRNDYIFAFRCLVVRETNQKGVVNI